MKHSDDFGEILKSAKLVVDGDRISVVKPDFVARVLDIVRRPPELVQTSQKGITAKASEVDPCAECFEELLEKLERLKRKTQAVSGNISLGGGRLHKALHKSLHKSLHKGLHKSLHKAAMGSASSGYAAADGLAWPTIEVPWRELGRLYKARDTAQWDQLPLLPPPAIEDRLAEIKDLHDKQEELREPEQAFRRERIRIEASNDLTAYMLPLGADVTSPASQTAVMFQTILWLGSLIGQLYKARFNAPRPHVLDPNLEPFIPVPAYSSYPSNHAFQSFLIAEVFNRAVPEHPGGAALYRAAREVAVNREWAGLHIHSDTEAGQHLARLCAALFEKILKDQIRAVRAEWLGEGYMS